MRQGYRWGGVKWGPRGACRRGVWEKFLSVERLAPHTNAPTTRVVAVENRIKRIDAVVRLVDGGAVRCHRGSYVEAGVEPPAQGAALVELAQRLTEATHGHTALAQLQLRHAWGHARDSGPARFGWAEHAGGTERVGHGSEVRQAVRWQKSAPGPWEHVALLPLLPFGSPILKPHITSPAANRRVPDSNHNHLAS